MDRVIINNVSKKFKIGTKKRQRTLFRLLSLISGKEPRKEIDVLKNITLSLESGKILGIIGKNGSGKSTLLRIIAGVYEADSGKVTKQGNIISLINLGAGMQERLSMFDNIYLCGSLFGLSRKEIKNRLNSISKFAELEDHMETKLYQFSEGMKQRLAFSIAMHCDPQILLLDEVFEIGDESFKEKSVKKIKELVKMGLSVILVTHDLETVKKYCNRVIWMRDGKIKQQGNPEEVIKSYLKS